MYFRLFPGMSIFWAFSARCGLGFCDTADLTGTVHGDAADVAGLGPGDYMEVSIGGSPIAAWLSMANPVV